MSISTPTSALTSHRGHDITMENIGVYNDATFSFKGLHRVHVIHYQVLWRIVQLLLVQMYWQLDPYLPKSMYFIQLYICKPIYIDKVVKIAHLSGDLTVGILNLNDDMIEYWDYVQPITVQERKCVFCAYWHKYCTDFGIVKPVT